MVLRLSENIPNFYIETYIGSSTLQANTYPIIPNTNYTKLYGLVKKIQTLDPRIANQFIYADVDIIANRFTESEKIKSLLLKDNIGISKQNINTDDELLLPIYPISEYLSNPLYRSDVEKSNIVEMLYKNKGFYIKPFLLYDNLLKTKSLSISDSYKNQLLSANYLKQNTNVIDKNNMSAINACKYKLHDGLSIQDSTYQDFLRITKLKQNETKPGQYKDLFNMLKQLKIYNKNTPFQSLNILPDFKKLITINSDSIQEQNRIILISKLTGMNESEIKENSVDPILQEKYMSELRKLDQENIQLENEIKEYTTKFETMLDNIKLKENKSAISGTKGSIAVSYKKNVKPKEIQLQKNKKRMQELFDLSESSKFTKFIETINTNYTNIAIENRERACNIVKALRSVGNNEGLHNRLKTSFNKLPSYTDLINTIELANQDLTDLNYCEDEDSECSLTQMDIGFNNPISQQIGSMETSSSLYMFVNIPMDVLAKTDQEKEKIKTFKYYLNGVKDVNVDFGNDEKKEKEKGSPSLNSVDYLKLHWLGELINFKITSPIDQKMDYLIENPKEIQKITDVDQIFEYKTQHPLKYYKKNIDILDGQEVTSNSIKFLTSFLDHNISENDVLENDIKQNNCLNVSMKMGSKLQKINPNLILLDGKQRPILFKKENGSSKTIRQVITEIELLDQNTNASDPRQWSWVCVTPPSNISKDYFQKTENSPYTIHSLYQNRSFDIYNLTKNKNTSSSVKKNLIKHSLADAIKDVAITGHNLINLGNMTQLNQYLENSWNILLPLDVNNMNEQLEIRSKDFQEIKEKTIENIKSFKLDKEYQIIENLVNEPTLSTPYILKDGILLNKKQNFLLRRRKLDSKETLGVIKPFDYNYLTDNITTKKSIQKNAPLAIVTNFDDVFQSIK